MRCACRARVLGLIRASLPEDRALHPAQVQIAQAADHLSQAWYSVNPGETTRRQIEEGLRGLLALLPMRLGEAIIRAAGPQRAQLLVRLRETAARSREEAGGG